MSSGTINTPRLLAAAKEFNIGKDTLVEFLTGKGFEIDGRPNTKLSEEMYYALQASFAQDKLVKKKSDEIALPKGSLIDSNIPKQELAPESETEKPKDTTAKKTVVKKPKKEEVSEPTEEETVVLKEEVITDDTPTTQVEEKVEVEEPIVVVPAVETKKSEEITEVVETPVQDEPTETETETTKSGIASKLQGPKILTKIDLDAINQTTRPKKATAKEKEAAKKSAAKKTTKVETSTKEKTDKQIKESPTPKVEPKPIVKPEAEDTKTKPAEPQEQEKETLEHIETKTMKLEGPKVIGKIELPAGTMGGRQERKEKRKRKRIPVDKKPETKQGGQGGQGSGGGQQKDRNDRPQRGGSGGGGRNDNRRGGGGRNQPQQQPQEIDAKEIQDKIRETQAKLAGGGARSKNLKAKYRRNKREEMAEKRAAEEFDDGSVIQVTEFISVSEFANLLNVSFADIISKCMSLGIMVSINQRLDAEVIELVASEFNKEVSFINLDADTTDEEDIQDSEEDLTPRAPVVTIMGHVDHGKTSLLDYIRNASVVAGEAGGITQHIGAYKVTTESGKDLTFLDTPGHEAFTAMRARGAKAADIAVIVIAADDAIMPQTKEAISHAQAAGLPMIFAINKIDKDGANPDKIKEQLSTMNILVEDWGGNFQSQEISAKSGLNVDVLLEKIIIESELLELKANTNRIADGTVIEASLDKGRGYVTTILVQGGTLHSGEMIVSGQHYGKVKAMFNERGQKVTEAGPSTPVQILGLNGAPQAGEKIKVFADESEAKNLANHRAQILREQGLRSRKHITLDEIGRRLALGNFKELNILIRADVDGSAEALSDSLQKLSTEEVAVNIIHKGVGQISEGDVNLASASDAIIIGFQVRPSVQASRLADQENIEIRYYSVIYDAIGEIKSAMEGLLEPTVEEKITGNIEVRETFKISGVGTIAGCYVLDGKFTRNTKIHIIRDSIVIHTGELSSLKRFKDDVKEVNAGYECGLTIKNYNDIQVGDIIEGYEEVEVKRKLS